MNIIQIGIIGIAGAVLAIQLKQCKAEYSVYLCIGISLLIFFSILSHLEMIVDTVREMTAFINMDMTYISTLLKMLGVTYVAEFASGICKDAGYQTLASQIEIFSKLTILVLSMPILVALLKTIQDFLS